MNLIKRWIEDKTGLAATEAALIFPVLLTILLGVFDVGNAILADQKTIRASQVTADLVTRLREVSGSDVEEAIKAGQLALMPFQGSDYGVDIVSIRFDENANAEIVWRETRNMSPIDTVLSDVSALAAPNDGVVVVSSQYDFEPTFAGFVMNSVMMQEVAFARGRLSAVVCREGAAGC